MRAVFSKLKIIIFLLFLMASTPLFSQTPQVWFSETEIEFEWKTEKKIAHTLEFASRGLLSESIGGERTSSYQHEFVELTYAPGYALTENSELSLGIRYRFSNLFDNTETNELRLIPQYEFGHASTLFDFSHGIRLEHRFNNPEYAFRPRYEFAVSKDLSTTFSTSLSTESLFSYSNKYKPEYEQRFAIEIENTSVKDLELILGFEFRLEDYTNDLEHEYFIMTGANISL